MSEQQAPTGDLGGVQPHFGFPREYIDACMAEEGEFAFGISGVDTRSSNEEYEAGKKVLGEQLDSVLRLYDHEPESWIGLAEELQIDTGNGLPTAVSGARIRARGITDSLGKYVHDHAYWAMPMERSDDGEGSVELTLKLSDDRHLKITGEGVYGRERFYKDPGAPRPEQPFMKDVAFEPVDDLDDPDYLGYQDWHRISFTGHIIPAPQPDELSQEQAA